MEAARRAGHGMSESLTSSTVHGMKWSYASTLVPAGLQIGVTALLARLLTPSAFGLVAMANVLLWYGVAPMRARITSRE